MSACAPPRLDVNGQTHVYRCADGFRFVVRYEPQRAWLFLGEQLESLPQVPSRDVLLYTNRAMTFTSDGNNAQLRVGPNDHTKCVNQPSEATGALK